MYHRAVEPPSDSQDVPTDLLNCYLEQGYWPTWKDHPRPEV
jgi:hypothetical protein